MKESLEKINLRKIIWTPLQTRISERNLEIHIINKFPMILVV